MKARTKKTINLGSGYTYISEFNGEMPSTMKALITTVCTEANRFGETKNGATLTYTAEKHKEEDDFGNVSRVIPISEDVKLKLGVFTFEPTMLEKLVDTYRLDETDEEYNVINIGGLDNAQDKRYVVVFRHIDKTYGDLYIVLVGTNTAGLTFAWAKDAATKLEPEFEAEPCEEGGTLLKIAWKKSSTQPDQSSQDSENTGG